MENFTLTSTRDGHILFNGAPTGFLVESTARNYWYLQRPGYAHKQFAAFTKKRNVMTAARVFIEGISRKPDESTLDAVIRALQSCLETGTTSIVVLQKREV
jgi:hypothetical protein